MTRTTDREGDLPGAGMSDGVSGKHVVPGLNPQGEGGQLLRPGGAQCCEGTDTVTCRARLPGRPTNPLWHFYQLGVLLSCFLSVCVCSSASLRYYATIATSAVEATESLQAQ